MTHSPRIIFERNKACANKCVFCWRHHTNPVGTEWRWVTDKPEPIVDQMLAGHRQMIKQLRGVPGVTSEKMVEGNYQNLVIIR